MAVPIARHVAGEETADELKVATALEREKQRLGIPSGAAVPADPVLLARKREMEN